MEDKALENAIQAVREAIRDGRAFIISAERKDSVCCYGGGQTLSAFGLIGYLQTYMAGRATETGEPIEL